MGAEPSFTGTSRRLRVAVWIGVFLLLAVVAGYVWRAVSETTRVRDAARQSIPRLDALLQSRKERDEEAALYDARRRTFEAEDARIRLPWSETRLRSSVARAAESAGCPAPARILPIAESPSAALRELSLATWELAWDRPEPCLPAIIAALAEGDPPGYLVNYYTDSAKAAARIAVPVLPVPPAFPDPAPAPSGGVDSVGRTLDRLRVALSAAEDDGIRSRQELAAALAEARALLQAGQSIEAEMREIQSRQEELGRYEEWRRRLHAVLAAECPPGGPSLLAALQEAGTVSWTLEARDGGWRIRAEYAPRGFETKLEGIPGLTLTERTRSGRFWEAILRPTGTAVAPPTTTPPATAPATQPVGAQRSAVPPSPAQPTTAPDDQD